MKNSLIICFTPKKNIIPVSIGWRCQRSNPVKDIVRHNDIQIIQVPIIIHINIASNRLGELISKTYSISF